MLHRPLRLTAASVVLFACVVCPVHASDRESWQPPDQIMDAVGVAPGMRIGEAGAGEGYLTFHLARRVGAAGIVYANEISQSDLDTIDRRAQSANVTNIVTVLGEVSDPLFPDGDLDMVIMVYVLHHLDRPIEFLQSLEAYLAPGAPVVVVEKNHSEDRTHPPHYMTQRQILETIEDSGYAMERTETFLPRDTIYIFRIDRPEDAP
jgi:ubiquinone/menaquinone biosynthesis C-methylase UbiE